MQLILNARFCGNVFVIECDGRLTIGPEAEALQAMLDARAREFTRLVIDVGSLARMDSTGLGLLVRFATRMRQNGGDLRLAAPPAYLSKLLELTKLTTLLSCFPTQEEAILSFLKQKTGHLPKTKHGPRVLFLDPSPEVCAFVGNILNQQGYDVQATCFIRDARILIQVNSVDYIVIGPGSPAITAKSVVDTLQALVPRAKAFQLGTDFAGRDANEAAEALLHLFRAATPA